MPHRIRRNKRMLHPHAKRIRHREALVRQCLHGQRHPVGIRTPVIISLVHIRVFISQCIISRRHIPPFNIELILQIRLPQFPGTPVLLPLPALDRIPSDQWQRLMVVTHLQIPSSVHERQRMHPHRHFIGGDARPVPNRITQTHLPVLIRRKGRIEKITVGMLLQNTGIQCPVR